jgi:hypothetical protein
MTAPELTLAPSDFLSFDDDATQPAAPVGSERAAPSPAARQQPESASAPMRVRDAARSGVFISYSRADEVFALNLAHRLKKAGIGAWLDMIDIDDEDDWQGEIDAALNRCGLMLAVLSPDALRDASARSECQQFMTASKPAIPVISRRCQMPDGFRLPPVDFSRDFTVGLNILLGALAVEIRRA